MKDYQVTEADIWAYISKQADEHTIRRVEDWMASDNYDKDFFEQSVAIHGATIDKEPNIEMAKTRFFEAVQPQKYGRNRFLKYAAVILFLLTSGILVNEFYLKALNNITIETAYSEGKRINLTDGSTVWLNASSKLTYSKKSPRTLKLQGEAFFEVAKNKEKPFTVTMLDGIKVRALGTSFNIRSYQEELFTETVLATGKVEVTSQDHFKEKIAMLPNDKVTFLQNELRVETSNVEYMDDITAWRQGKLQFRRKRFRDIAIDLKVRFNVNITFNNQTIADSRFTGSFQDNTAVDEILETLKASKAFEYENLGEEGWVIK